MAFVVVVESCWQWIGSVNADGYGRTSVGGRGVQAHRLMYELRRGAIPEGLELDHLCRNPGCVNPDHLEPVTRRENVLRGNNSRAIVARTGVCLRGHSITGENRMPEGAGFRCRTCRRESRHRSRALGGEMKPNVVFVTGYCIVNYATGDIYGTGIWDTREDAREALNVSTEPDNYRIVRMVGRYQ